MEVILMGGVDLTPIATVAAHPKFADNHFVPSKRSFGVVVVGPGPFPNRMTYH
jgi:hypothetical protein